MQSNVFNTRFVGHSFVKLVKVDSTNNYLKNLLSNFEPLPQGTVIMADEQFAGRGQSNHKWLSQKGKNLTFSIFLMPNFLAVQQQFKLNQAITLGITDCLIKLLGNNCKIKWPNDIYFNADKIGGILIENTVRGHKISESVVGIGLNVNQKQFDSSLKNANSLAHILGVDFDLIGLLGDILKAIEIRYDMLEAGMISVLDKDFTQRLLGLNTLCQFSNRNEIFWASIVDVSETGLLILETETGQKWFNVKEVMMVI
ncbi:MAG: biotin--[acetyl-CoA-carboxylase] ligase [Sphingobacteriales bacterium]|nr:MAG: biotin--[acetyl-CoA-carboxylase] ligase [Sphingobacteriales bacterium]TAF82298.1 MAG: biotin--[acetyl-CoA-carboxylase] ligase [Sphingobacteriales bacterium]